MKKIILLLVVIVLVTAGVLIYQIGPRNIVGRLLYDQRREGDLKVGAAAPDVALTSADGKMAVHLREYIGPKPLILVFGSYTWPPFRRSVELIQKMHQEYRDRANFLTIYIKEAHTDDEWQVKKNEESGICYAQPKSMDARLRIVHDFVRRFDYQVPVAVDGMDNRANEVYAAWPERLYVIDEQGTIVYKGKPGPRGYHPEEVLEWLAKRFPS